MSGASTKVVIRAAIVIALVGALVWFVTSRGSGGDTAGSGPAGETGDPPAAGRDTECGTLHEGHAAMAWNPTSADEMVDADCGWPYEPYLITAEGGQEDPAIEVEFEPRLYEELSDVIGEMGLGLCSVNTLPEEPGDGFVFGFRYDAAEPGCPGLEPSVELSAREYVTRAHRDAAANAGVGDDAIVLGRWVLTAEGTDQAAIDQLTDRLLDMGGQAVNAG